MYALDLTGMSFQGESDSMYLEPSDFNESIYDDCKKPEKSDLDSVTLLDVITNKQNLKQVDQENQFGNIDAETKDCADIKTDRVDETTDDEEVDSDEENSAESIADLIEVPVYTKHDETYVDRFRDDLPEDKESTTTHDENGVYVTSL